MKILVKFNKNISTPKQVKSFKVFDLGIVDFTYRKTVRGL